MIDGIAIGQQRGRHPCGGRSCFSKVLGPTAAALRLIDAQQKGRNHFPQLRQNLIGIVLRFAERAGAQAKQQRFVRLSGAEQPEVRLHGGRQQSTQRIERFCANRRPVHTIAVGRIPGKPRAKVRLHRFDPARVGFEEAIQRGAVMLAKRRAFELPGHVVLPAAGRLVRVWDVACRLFEIRHQPSPLDHFREDVRDALARQVHAAKLRDRIVSIFGKDLGIKAFGALESHAALGRRHGADVFEKFVEKQPPQRFRRSRIPREERALHGFRQIGQRENRTGETRKIRRERFLFVCGEFRHGAS